jgi:hypothetical protein
MTMRTYAFVKQFLYRPPSSEKLVANPEFPNIVVKASENSMPNRNQVPILYLYDVYLLARWRLFTGSKYPGDLIMFKNAGAF